MPPIEVGKWLIWLVVGVLGQVAYGQDRYGQNPVVQLSPSANGNITELQVIEYGSGAVGVYNFARIEDGNWVRLYVFRLEDDVVWYTPFWPAQDMQLTRLSITETSRTLKICGWRGAEQHCWQNGTLADEYPYFRDFQYTMTVWRRTFLPTVSK